jgi:hypothetical protein
MCLLNILILLSALDSAWFVTGILCSTLAWLSWMVLGQAGQSTAALLRATGSQAQAPNEGRVERLIS